MSNDIIPINFSEGEIVLYQPDENISLEVKLDAAHETVWLTQQQIADLFGVKQPAISKHLNNIFKTGELDQASVHSILEYTAADGKKYKTQFYNLDAIISVGYRVNTLVPTSTSASGATNPTTDGSSSMTSSTIVVTPTMPTEATRSQPLLACRCLLTSSSRRCYKVKCKESLTPYYNQILKIFLMNSKKINKDIVSMQQNLIPLTLAEHQQVLYEILYMVDDFCKAHDIPYFLVGGTLLGAVRHKGIIPWDDDVDIAMTRENYERFIKEFHAEGVNGYELYDYEHTDGYLFPFAKMGKTDSWTSLGPTYKISIDIFVYDGCGNNRVDAINYFEHHRRSIRKIINNLFSDFNVVYDCWKAKLYYLATDFWKYYPLRFFPTWRSNYIREVYSRCKQYSVTDTKYSACIVWGLYNEGEVQLSSSFLQLTTMKFGERHLPVPSGWHDYLQGIYGDYMQLPPKEKQIAHHFGRSYRVIQVV